MSTRRPVYITTPIYYVNDRPHIGHCYTTLVADVAARFARLLGHETFFLTGTDEHAEKVSRAASERGLTPQAWADQNAAEFRRAFADLNLSYNDFIRTSEDRHKRRATSYIKALVDKGDIELGTYEGWWDGSQEEYLTESTAREHDYKSPVTKEPLEKRSEENYFFRLDRYEKELLALIDSGRMRILPESRRNEVVSRIRQGLQKVPVSRRIREGDPDWGVLMPGDDRHRVYVWIEALCNYLTAIDNERNPPTVDEEGGPRRKFWPRPASPEAAMEEGVDSAPSLVAHYMAKDILWFHAVIWPAMLTALGERPPSVVYAHAYFVAEGRKMSKSLGNFIEIDQLRAYSERYSRDAVRWYLATQGPLGSTDSDFAYGRFVEVFNADLANGIGNCASRVGNMISKYFDGQIPECERRDDFEGTDWAGETTRRVNGARALFRLRDQDSGAAVPPSQLDAALREGIRLVAQVDEYIGVTKPFMLAKADPDENYEPQVDRPSKITNREALATILYNCAEAVRIASLLLYPAMPEKMAQLWRNWSCSPLNDPDDPESGFKAPLALLAEWGGSHMLKAGTPIRKGEHLFSRADPDEPPPATIAAPAQEA